MKDFYLVRDHARPIATVSLSLPGGVLDDPEGREGLASFTADMLFRGAGGLAHEDVLDEIDFLGSTLSVQVGRDTTSVAGDALVRNFDDFEGLVAKLLLEPSFPEDEVERLRREVLAELVEVRDHDPSLGQRAFVKRLFAGHAYGRPQKGTPESVAAIMRDDVVSFWRQRYRSSGLIVGGAGDITDERLAAFAERTAGRLPGGGEAVPAPGLAPEPSGWSAVLVDKPDRSQTQVFLGHPAVHSTHEDFLPLFVAHVCFGGTFTSRLSHEIREKRGWSYGAYSYLHADPRLGTFMMRYYPQAKDTVPALQVTKELFDDFARTGPTEAELENAKRYLCLSHPMSLETPEKELHERLGARLSGHPDDWVDRFPDLVGALTLDQVAGAVRRHLTPDRLVVAIVCTAKDLTSDLERSGLFSSLDVVDFREA